jgi:hypothetical protein
MAEEETSGPLIFDPVWLILERPRPNFNPGRFLAPGKLQVEGRRAEFSPSEAKLRLGSSPRVRFTCDQIIGVRRERYGWGLVPRFVAIEYRAAEGGTDVAYFNDAEWNGWRPLLTRVNQRMAEAIQGQLGPE